MIKRNTDFTLPKLDDLFTTQEMRDDAKLERVKNIPLDELHPFKNHPFKILNNEEMERMIESIRKVGAITPALARPLPDGGYELISGHRRLAACQVLGIETMPVITREMSDDKAVIAMVDANLQRETILPSEKAFAYKMKRDALNHQSITSPHIGEKWHDRWQYYEVTGVKSLRKAVSVALCIVSITFALIAGMCIPLDINVVSWWISFSVGLNLIYHSCCNNNCY